MNQVKYGILHWGPCVVKTTVDQNTLDLLLSEGEASKEDASPELAGVLKNQFHYRDKKKFSKFMEEIFNLYNYAIQQWKIWPKEKVPGTYYLEKLWINYQRRYDHNPPHQHHGIVSFVVYLDVPKKIFDEQANSNVQDAGKTVFKYGESISPLSVNMWNVTPEKNLILMFPATLDHMVHPFWVDEERISVSGNFTLTDRIVLSQNGA